jgi:hypothetical protein
MARRKQVSHSQATKSRIKTTQLVIRLQSNAFGTLKHPMNRDQIRCAEILLKKTLPDLASLHVEAELDHEVTITWQK